MSKRACYVLLNSYIVIWLVVDEERRIWERRKGGGGLRRIPKYNYQKSTNTKLKDSRHRRGEINRTTNFIFVLSRHRSQRSQSSNAARRQL